jgi:hypothetical protein
VLEFLFTVSFILFPDLSVRNRHDESVDELLLKVMFTKMMDARDNVLIGVRNLNKYLLEKSAWYTETWAGKRTGLQHDAHEFLQYLIQSSDALGRHLSFLHGGVPNTCLTVHMLQEAIDMSSLVHVQTRGTITRFNDLLCVHVARFTQDGHGNCGKNNTPVTQSTHLSLYDELGLKIAQYCLVACVVHVVWAGHMGYFYQIQKYRYGRYVSEFFRPIFLGNVI